MPRRKPRVRPAASSAKPLAATTPPTPTAPALSPPTRVINRGELARIEFIHERLREVRPDGKVKVTVASLARELSRSRAVIFETFATMRETFGAPIKYDPLRGTQYYDQPPGALPFELRPRVSVDARQALALMIGARRLFPFGAILQDLLPKILPLLDGAVTLDPAAIDAICSTPEHPASEADADHFLCLFYAIARRQEVQFTYTKLVEGAQSERRIVHPLHLVILSDGCILVAHDPVARDRRNFEITRLTNPQPTGATFVPPAGFDLKKYLAGSTGRYIGDAQHTVRLRFASSFVPYVTKHPWHRPQVLQKEPDGSAETTYEVAHTKEIEQRVLAAAGQVEVLSPPDLRARIRAAAEALRKTHV